MYLYRYDCFKKIILITFFIIASLTLKAQILCDKWINNAEVAAKVDDWKNYPTIYGTDSIKNVSYKVVQFEYGGGSSRKMEKYYRLNCATNSLLLIAVFQEDYTRRVQKASRKIMRETFSFEYPISSIETIHKKITEKYFIPDCKYDTILVHKPTGDYAKTYYCNCNEFNYLNGSYREEFNNKLSCEGQFMNGFKTGIWKYFDEHGETIFIYEFGEFGLEKRYLRRGDPDWPY